MPHLQEIIVVDKKRFGLHWLNIIKFSIFRRWDLVIDLRSSVTSYFLNTKKRMIFRGNELSHKVMQFREFIDTKEALIPEIWYSQEDADISYKKIKNNDHLIAVAPYSNWPKKDWSLKKYKNLFQNEFFKNHTIILTGISRDIINKREIEEFINTSELEIINLFDWGNLRNMVPIFKKCRFFIGSDSGLMHLAASSGCKTVALFGPTNDLVYGPWGNHKVIKSDKDRDYGLENLSVENVLNSIKEFIR
jgi:ADP-heptose:LPS heptosyltransferase